MQKFKLQSMANRYGWDTSQLRYVAGFLEGLTARYWIAGGALRRPILKQDTIKESDFDLFFGSEQDWKTVRERLISRGFQPKRENEFNDELTFEGTKNGEPVLVKVQLIKIEYYNSLEDVLNSFDFTLCQLGWEVSSDDFVCSDTALFDIANKKLVVHHITYPVASLRRILKYTKQGFYACQGFMTEFLSQVQDHTTDIANEKVRYFD